MRTTLALWSAAPRSAPHPACRTPKGQTCFSSAPSPLTPHRPLPHPLNSLTAASRLPQPTVPAGLSLPCRLLAARTVQPPATQSNDWTPPPLRAASSAWHCSHSHMFRGYTGRMGSLQSGSRRQKLVTCHMKYINVFIS